MHIVRIPTPFAKFNYTGCLSNEAVNLTNAGLPPATFVATDLLAGTTSQVTNTMSVSLDGDPAKFFTLAIDGPQPRFISISPADAGTFAFSGTNGVPGWNYSILESTNPALPVTRWQSVGTNSFDTNGNFSFTNDSGQNSMSYYLLKLQQP